MPRGTDRYDEALMQDRLWTPSQWPKTKFVHWHDASLLSSFTTISGAISVWADRSGNDRNMTQATAGNRPVIDMSHYGPRPAVKFISDVLATNSYVSPQYYTVFVVVKLMTAPSLNEQILLAGSTVGTSQQQYMRYSESLGQWQTITSNTAPTFFASSITATWSDPALLCGRRDVSSIVLRNFGNSATPTTTTGTARTQSMTVATGADITVADNDIEANGGVNEIILMSEALPVWELELVEGYLAWKWLYQDRLAARHPYKNHPPLIGR